MNKQVLRALLWVLTLGLMTVIFCFSSQGSTDSMATSGFFAEPAARLLAPLFPNMAWEDLLWAVQVVVRKLGHFTEYTALGCAIRWLLMSYGAQHAMMWAWVAGTLYAATDEIHQLFTGSRTGMWQDVVLDSAGVVTGALVAALLVRIGQKIIRKKAA